MKKTVNKEYIALAKKLQAAATKIRKVANSSLSLDEQDDEVSEIIYDTLLTLEWRGIEPNSEEERAEPENPEMELMLSQIANTLGALGCEGIEFASDNPNEDPVVIKFPADKVKKK